MKHLFLLTLLFLSIPMFSQTNEFISLWPGLVPGENKEKLAAVISPQRSDIICYEEVSTPGLEVFIPTLEKNNGVAIIVCPGGGYNILAYDKEGTEIAKWLNDLGFTAFVLQYRVPKKREGALQDAQRAIRVVRDNSAKYKITTQKVGIMGFSAGGSLSARASCLFDSLSYPAFDSIDKLTCRPDFTILIYPAYLDKGPNRSLTPELELSKNVPPMFIFQTTDDEYANSAIVMAGALRDAGLSVELHLLPKGGHGYGLRKGTYAGETWPVLAEKWLNRILTDSLNK